MTVEEKMQAIMVAAPGITALVPASRIKVNEGFEYQNLARPYIFHGPVALQPIYTHEGMARLRIWSFYQISIFVDALPGAIKASTIREALIATLVPYKDADINRIAFISPGGPGDSDLDKKISHMPLNFSVAEGLIG